MNEKTPGEKKERIKHMLLRRSVSDRDKRWPGSTYIGEAPLLPVLAIEGEEGRGLRPPCTDFDAAALGVDGVWQEEEEGGG